MMMCRITNLTSMSIVIEDIGVRLQPTGGSGSHAVVRADTADRSSDLKNYSTFGGNRPWLRIERFEVVPTANAIKSQNASPPPPQTETELEQLRKHIEDMSARQEKMMEMLAIAFKNPPNVPGVATDEPRQFTSAPSPQRTQSPADIDFEPIIMPGKMVPDSVEVSVQAREEEREIDDFDLALQALKKVKR